MFVEYFVSVPLTGFVAGTVTFTFKTVGGMFIVIFCAEKEGVAAFSREMSERRVIIEIRKGILFFR